MKALPEKTLRIKLTYRSNKDLFSMLKNIRLEIDDGSTYEKSNFKGNKYSFEVNKTSDAKIEVRLENINGNKCIIIPSKMNYE